MDPILQTLFSWQFVIFGMSIAAVMFVIRKVAEYAMSNWAAAAKESKLWNDLLLPILPVILGATSALLIKTFPYPEGLHTGSSRFIFGLVAGLLSTLLYRVFKALMVQKIQGQPQSYGYPGVGYPGVQPCPPPGVAQAGVITPDNPVNPEELAAQVRQTIKND